MTIRDDGGPAYPTTPVSHGYSPTSEGHGTGAGTGMSLREYYAGQIIKGLLANPNVVVANPNNGWNLCNCTTAQLSAYAFSFADDMLYAKGG